MATLHFNNRRRIITGFSSWAASLHLVLCYARSLQEGGFEDVHVAVMDTQDLDNEVLIWHCPHLFDLPRGRHEYLAYGRIRGRGYKAVHSKDLVSKRLYTMFSHLNDGRYRYSIRPDHCQFGAPCRRITFEKEPQAMTQEQMEKAASIATLFGDLYLPVCTMLLCPEPRPQLMMPSRHMVCRQLSQQTRSLLNKA